MRNVEREKIEENTKKKIIKIRRPPTSGEETRKMLIGCHGRSINQKRLKIAGSVKTLNEKKN